MMKKIHERRAAGQGGFTLIELLVVIAILAVLGGAAVIGIGGLRDSAEEQVCKTDQETYETALEAYTVTNPTVNPTTINTATLTGNGVLKAGKESKFWNVTAGVVVPNATNNPAPGDCSAV